MEVKTESVQRREPLMEKYAKELASVTLFRYNKRRRGLKVLQKGGESHQKGGESLKKLLVFSKM